MTVAAIAAPVLEPAKHSLDLMALAIEHGVIQDRHLAACIGRYAGGDAAGGQTSRSKSA